MANVSTRIAYVTDLHLGSSSAAGARLASFSAKAAQLRSQGIRTIINGGDLFDLRGDMWRPNGVVDSSLSMERRIELSDYSAALVRDLFGKISSNTGSDGLFFSVLGNADFLSAKALYGFKAAQPLKTFHSFQSPLADPYNGKVSWTLREEGLAPIFIAGLSGIPALSCDAGARNVNTNNPWYMGVLTSERYSELVSKLGIPGRENIVVTHMPAQGTMDSFHHIGMDKWFTDQGSVELRAAIEELNPILHLTGHVHGAPTVAGDYRPFVVSDGKTVTVNPGGADLHDEELGGINGVKIAVIDPFKLIEIRNSGALTEENIMSEKAVEVI
jgi:hypothetical protein